MLPLTAAIGLERKVAFAVVYLASLDPEIARDRGRAEDGEAADLQVVARQHRVRADPVRQLLDPGDALVAGDLAALGRVVERSQAGAERLLGNQVRETIWLARRARELGAVAASAFGAGFGGSVWALVRQDIIPELLERWRDDYLETFPRRSAARFFGTIAGPPASVTPALPLETVP